MATVVSAATILVRLQSTDNQSSAEDAISLCSVTGDKNGIIIFDFIPSGIFVDTQTDGA
jgi:hypothetical protein